MRRKQRMPGLCQRADGYWQIDKRIKGFGALRESTGTKNYEEAERYARHRIGGIEQAVRYGTRQRRTFAQAVERYLSEYGYKRGIERDARALKDILPWIGAMSLDSIYMETLQQYIDSRMREVKASTINRTLAVVRRILNLSARLWRDEFGKTWLAESPLLRLLPVKDARKPRPCAWAEQRALLAALPPHLAEMALFGINTGCRESEICGLRWDQEYHVKALGVSVFVLSGEQTKNSEDRVIVLNSVARAVIERRRGIHDEYVFTFRGHPLAQGMNNTGWRKARARAGIPMFRVHDLRHTFGGRLRSAGVSFEDRQDLLGHKSGRITTHYSAAEIGRLLVAVELISEPTFQESPNLHLIKSEKRAATY